MKHIHTFEAFLNEVIRSPKDYIENNKKRPSAKGTYAVIYSDGSDGEEEWDGHSWKVYPHPVAYWKPLKESVNEGSDITPERMLRSVYDNLKTSLNVGKIDAKSDYPYFNFSAGNLVKGTVESRDGKILISFDEINIKVNPKQRDIVYDGDVVLTKDYIRNEALKIIRDYIFTVGKLK